MGTIRQESDVIFNLLNYWRIGLYACSAFRIISYTQWRNLCVFVPSWCVLRTLVT